MITAYATLKKPLPLPTMPASGSTIIATS